MLPKESNVSRLARKYLRVPKRERRSKKARELRSGLNCLIENELDKIESKKRDLIYHMHELETLYEDGKASDQYYHKAHDDIQERIHLLDVRSDRLREGLKNPEVLVDGGRSLRLNRAHIIVFGETLLVLIVVYIYYKLVGRLPSIPK